MEFGNPQSFDAPGYGEIVFNDMEGTSVTRLGGVETGYPTSLTEGSGYLLQYIGNDSAGTGAIRAPYEDRANKRGAFGHIFRRSAGFLQVEGIICGADRGEVAEMSDALRAISEPLLEIEGRYYYNPSGSFRSAGGTFTAHGIGATDVRFNPCRLYEDPDIQHQPRSTHALAQLGGALKAFAMTFMMMDPIWLTLTQDSASNVGATYTIPNDGSADTFPVYKVHAVSSPCTQFIIARSDGFEIKWNGSLAAGHYIEINTYNETMYTDGNGSDRLGGLDLASSDFFTSRAGGDLITFTSIGGAATLDVLSNDAWTMG